MPITPSKSTKSAEPAEPVVKALLRGSVSDPRNEQALTADEPASRPRRVMPAPSLEAPASRTPSQALPLEAPVMSNKPARGDHKQTFAIKAFNNERLLRVAYWKRKSKGELVNAALDFYLRNFPEALDPIPLD